MRNSITTSNYTFEDIITEGDLYVDKTDEAIARIRQQGYATPYLASGKPITLIGINFSKEKRNIAEWKEEYC